MATRLPSFATPPALDLRAFQLALNNIRESLQRLDARVSALTAQSAAGGGGAGTGTNSLAGLRQQIASLRSDLDGVIAVAGEATTTGDSYVASADVAAYTCVMLDAAGLAAPADAAVLAHAGAALGLALDAAVAGEQLSVRAQGTVEHEGWTWTPGAPVLLGLAGALVQTIPPTAAYVQVVGWARSATRVLVRLAPPMILVPTAPPVIVVPIALPAIVQEDGSSYVLQENGSKALLE